MRGISTVSVLALLCTVALPALATEKAVPTSAAPIPLMVNDSNAAKGTPVPAMAMPSGTVAAPTEKKGFLSSLFGEKQVQQPAPTPPPATPTGVAVPSPTEPAKAFATIREGDSALWTINPGSMPDGGNVQCTAARSLAVNAGAAATGAAPIAGPQGMKVFAVRIHNPNATPPMMRDTLQFNVYKLQTLKDKDNGLLVGGEAGMKVINQANRHSMNGEVTDIDVLKKMLTGSGNVVFKMSGDTLTLPAAVLRDVVVKLDSCVTKGGK